MTQPSWHYKKQEPGDTTREPVQGEFFAVESIENAATAVVREGIQNCLDAGRPGETVRVRIHVSGQDGAVPPDRMATYLAGTWPHFGAEKNGLREPPADGEPCAFLTFEDFGTKGLAGDIEQWHRKEGVRNDFFNFFRAEGQSDKESQDRGRWGIGKFVFPRSSRVHALFGVTVRECDGQRHLLGRSVLKSHLLDGEPFWGNGYFGVPHPNYADFVLPTADSAFIDRFCEDFRLNRGVEPGLSVVVPWCEDEVTTDCVADAVIRGYFYPLLAGKLTVTISNATHETVWNRELLLDAIKAADNRIPADLLPLLRLALWAGQNDPALMVQLLPPVEGAHGAVKWAPEAVPAEAVARIRAAIQSGDPVAMRIPITVTERGGQPQPSYFDAFLIRDSSDEGGRPIFIREGIIIPDVRAPRARGMRSFVIIEDPALNQLLRAAEGVAHTQWSQNSEGFKQRYKAGKSYLDYVKDGVARIVQYVSDDQKPDPTALVDFFSLPAPTEEETTRIRKPKPKPDPGDGLPPPPPPLPKKPRAFTLEPVKGGFTVYRGDPESAPPAFLEVRAAYDVRRGNPLAKYDSADFDMGKTPIAVETSEGLDIYTRMGNRIFARVKAPDFRLTMKGFDEDRDLYVCVQAKGGDDADPQA